MEGVQPLNENVGNVPRSRCKWNKLLLVASGIQGLGLVLCLTYICLHFYYPQVQYPPIQSIGVQLTRYRMEKVFLITAPNEAETMKVTNNSIIISCDGFYLISLKGFFFQEVEINLHYRRGRKPILISSKDRRVNFTTVIFLAFKDKVYLNVNTHNTSCEHLQMNGGELILIQQNPGGFCAS
ncbi:tumor necrosis factor ligand superfamily member 4 [Castor canadensis]|uniref:Tumor necrosis factor ligand superfamily member 4 n=1 Tax=Castor canadensis TaxID=51338 RepID=A0A8B7TXR7_CASCN|nr:tumor necrosis factor ligand superfamily member 4 [Castor canadensis]